MVKDLNGHSKFFGGTYDIAFYDRGSIDKNNIYIKLLKNHTLICRVQFLGTDLDTSLRPQASKNNLKKSFSD